MGLFSGPVERRSWIPEPPVPAYPGGPTWTSSGSYTGTGAQALQVPTVWACVSLLANTVSMMDVDTLRDSPDGTQRRVPAPSLLRKPAAGTTFSEWVHALMVSALLRGNAIGWMAQLDGNGYPTQIELWHPDTVQIREDPDGGPVEYRNRKGELLDSSRVFHMRGLTLPGSKVGLSPVAYAAAVLGVDVSSRTFAQDYFTGGGIPKAVLKHPSAVNQEQARTVKERLLASMRAREPIILGAGYDYQQIQVSPEESQFLATQQANVGQIARYFNVPAGLVGGTEGGSMTYANVEQRSLDFLTYGVTFWLRRIEDTLAPLLPGATRIRFDPSALLRTDAETAAKVDAIRVATKVISPSEARAALGKEPMSDTQKAEVDMVPLTVTPTGMPKLLGGAPPPVEPTPNQPDPISDKPAA